MDECNMCTMDNYLYPLECPGNHKYCLSCIKGMSLSSSPGRARPETFQCPECRYKITRRYIQCIYDTPNKILKVDNVLNGLVSRPYVWLYEGRNNGWWCYNHEMQDIIEDAYLSNKDYVEWVVCGQKVKIDFIKRLQYNVDTDAIRAIQRISGNEINKGQSTHDHLLIKGVGGMQ